MDCLLFVTHCMKKYWRYGIIGCVGIALSLGYWRYSETRLNQFRIFFLNIGQGDSTLIQFRSGERMLVDCGPDSTVLARLGAVLPWYVRKIDTLLLTHPDSDHYAGCIDVLKRYEVTRIITNGETKPDELYQSFARGVAEEPGAIAFVQQKSERIEIAGTILEFLSPDPELPLKVPADDSNNRGIVFRLIDGPTKQSVLFSADMEEPLERALLKRYCNKPRALYVSNTSSMFTSPCEKLEAQVLKIGHHGSQTSSGKDFIAAVSPKTAVISAGKRNKFGHPSLRVIRRLERAGITILRTDHLGDIVID